MKVQKSLHFGILLVIILIASALLLDIFTSSRTPVSPASPSLSPATPTPSALPIIPVTPIGSTATPIPSMSPTPSATAAPSAHSLQLPVLLYHRFGEPGDRYRMPLWKFGQQLDWLQQHGYTTVTLDQVYQAVLGSGSLPPKPVVLTFDDADPSQWEAAAALDAHGMQGVFFITLGQRRLSDAQLRSLAQRGHELEDHTLTHPDLRHVSESQLGEEVSGSREQLQAITGQPVHFFAYPYGARDAHVVAVVQQAGYRGAVVAWGGRTWTTRKRWIEPREEVAGDLSLAGFAALLG